jgi:hypothetical protein
MRRAAKVDGNHAQITAEFRKLGCSVLDMSRLGEGAPDLLIGYGGLTMLVEVKDGSLPPSRRTLTTDQVQFWLNWKQNPRIVKNTDDVAKTVNVLMTWDKCIREGIQCQLTTNSTPTSTS